MKEVSSSSISHIGYDPESQTMHVRFHSGHTYSYAGVTQEQHDAFVNADSIGGHFHRHIRPNFDGRPSNR